MNRWLAVAVAVAAIALMFARDAPTAYGATFAVTKTADTADGVCDADCSLREAIIAANAAPSADTITVPAGTYALSIPGADENAGATGDLDITAALTINGVGAVTTIIDGADLDRVFDIGSGVTAVISGLTIRNGTSVGGLTGGGGIINFGTTTLMNSTVSANSSPHGVGGGGIYNSSGTLTLANSTVSSNSTIGTSSGGGILNGGTLTLNSSTVSGNSTTGLGGGIYHGSGTLTLTNSTVSANSSTGVAGGGGIINYGTTTLTNSTVSGNTAGSGPGSGFGGGIVNYGNTTLTSSTVSGNSTAGAGGGIFNSSGMTTATVTVTNGTISGNAAGASGGGGVFNLNAILTLTNSTVSGNSTTGLGGGILASGAEDIRNTIVAGNGPPGADCSGAITSAGHNLDGDGSCGLTGPGDLSNADPMLGSLANNGGPTRTYALLPGSPAIDAGDNVGCPLTDQRGAARPLGSACDIGAYEFGDADADGMADASDPNDDNDMLLDTTEAACGSNPLFSSSLPERLDGVFATADDDGDTLVDEPLPPGAVAYDCDGDGFVGTSEMHVFSAGGTANDQDACGGTGWPADLVPGGFQPNALNIQDLGSYVAPLRRLNTSLGDAGYDVRWDLIPGTVFGETINIADMGAFFSGATGFPPMLGAQRAYNHVCPWAP